MAQCQTVIDIRFRIPIVRLVTDGKTRRTQPRRSPTQAAISISLPRDLLEQLDERAAELNMSRSKYLTYLALRDLRTAGDFGVPAAAPTYTLNDADPSKPSTPPQR